MDSRVIRNGKIRRGKYPAQIEMPKLSVFTRVIHFIFDKLFKINDSAKKVALGVALGVFTGFFPGTGPAAALFLARASDD